VTNTETNTGAAGSVARKGAEPAAARSAEANRGRDRENRPAVISWARAHRPSGPTFALLPFLAFVGVFLLWPTAVVVVHAVTPGGRLGLSTLTRAISGPYRSAFENSLTLSATTAVVGGLLGLLLALALRGLTRPAWLRPALDAWCAVASQLGGVPLAFAFVAALGTQGVVTKMLKAVGIDIIGSGFSLSTLAGVVLVYMYFQIPLMFLVVMPAVAGLRDTWREAATVLGAGPVRYWRTVAAPILMPSTLGGMLLLFINAFSAYATVYVLNSSGQLVPLQIRFVLQGNVISGEQDLGYALVVWTVLLLLASLGLMNLLQRRAARWARS
jgi:putative spermidine/putrescine transport system permease protein